MSLTIALTLWKSLIVIDKQDQIQGMTSIPTANMLANYNTNAPNIHYTLHNLFRGLKSIRRKYKLTINEIMFLNGMYLYCKHISTCMSQDACLKFIGYYNLNKIKYYLGSLQSKGMIEIAEVIHSYNRYRLTVIGISAVNDINESFDRCLYDWFNKYNICL
jgi:hypothetical protein